MKILELQGTVGSDAARLAALNRSEKQLACMQDALKLMDGALEKRPHGIRQWLDGEYQLYFEIAALNNVRVAEFTPEVLAEHAAIVEKIEQQDADSAAHEARAHFTNASARTAARGDLRD